MKNLTKIVSIILILIMGITIFTGCEETTAQNLIYETTTPVRTLDPQTLSGETDLQIAYSIYSGLMRFDNGGNILPDLASKYTIANNNKKYIFTISEDAVWSNGEKITAYDFEFALKRAVLPETEAPFAHSLSPIVNAAKITQGKKSVDTLGVKALDPKTLEINLAYACVDFLQILTTPISMPCNEKFFLQTKGYYGLNDEAILTCGKYTLSNWNENYLGIKSESNSVYIYFDDSEKYLESLGEQEVDITKISYSLLDTAYKNGVEGNFSFVSDTVNLLTINPESPVANQTTVNALMSVADMPNEKNFNESFGISKLNSIYPSSVIGIENINTNDDADKYKSLAEDLFLDGCEEFDEDFKIPPLTLIYVDDPVSHAVAMEIAGVWQGKFGITVNIEGTSTADELYGRVENKFFDFAIIPLKATLPSPHSYVEQFTNNKMFDLFSLSSDELISATKKLHNSTTSKQLQKISSIITNNLYIKPLYQSSQVFYNKDGVTSSINSYSKRIEFENTTKK